MAVGLPRKKPVVRDRSQGHRPRLILAGPFTPIKRPRRIRLGLERAAASRRREQRVLRAMISGPAFSLNARRVLIVGRDERWGMPVADSLSVLDSGYTQRRSLLRKSK